MTLSELARYDGQEGRQAYIAVNGKIYDVTESPRWKNGLHPPDHRAGRDLTEELAGAPHVRAVVERFPVVGALVEESVTPADTGRGKMILGIILLVVVAAVVILMLR